MQAFLKTGKFEESNGKSTTCTANASKPTGKKAKPVPWVEK